MDFDTFLATTDITNVEFKKLRAGTGTSSSAAAAASSGSAPINNPEPVTHAEPISSIPPQSKKRGGTGTGRGGGKKFRSARDAAEHNMSTFEAFPSQGGYFINPNNETDLSSEQQWDVLKKVLMIAGGNEVTDEAETEDPGRLERRPPRTPFRPSGEKAPIIELFDNSPPASPTHPPPPAGSHGEGSSGLPPPPEATCSILEPFLGVPLEDVQSQWDLLKRGAPRSIMTRLSEVTDLQWRRAKIQQAFLNFTMFVEDHRRTHQKNLYHKEVVSVNTTMNLEVEKLKKRCQGIEEREAVAEARAKSADEAKMKAEAELATVAALREELETAQKELAEKQITCDHAVLAQQQAEAARAKAEEDVEKLRTFIPKLFYKALGSTDVMGPFQRLLLANLELGRLEMFNLFRKEVDLPEILPEAVTDFADEGCKARRADAAKELKDLKVPLIEQVGGPVPLPVDRILEM